MNRQIEWEYVYYLVLNPGTDCWQPILRRWVRASTIHNFISISLNKKQAQAPRFLYPIPRRHGADFGMLTSRMSQDNGKSTSLSECFHHQRSPIQPSYKNRRCDAHSRWTCVVAAIIDVVLSYLRFRVRSWLCWIRGSCCFQNTRARP